MLCESEDIPVLQPDDKTKVKFYTLIPITEEEKELVYEHGSEAVKKCYLVATLSICNVSC